LAYVSEECIIGSMIAQLKGKLDNTGAGFVIIDVGGIGYQVNVTADTWAELSKKKGEEIKILTHMIVREDAQDLYGFFKEEEVQFFKMLIKISGVGPKSALAIMSVAPIEILRSAIAQGDNSYLTKVSGVGRKTAEKVVLELKDQFTDPTDKELADLKGDMDTFEALKSLGYSQREAREAIKKIPMEIKGTNERIKEALKNLTT